MNLRHLFCSLLISLSLSTQADSITAPEFSLASNQGDTISLSDQRGKVVLINFWATWCGPCRKEMPALEALYQKYQDQGLEILAISVDSDPVLAETFIAKQDISFPILFDPENQVNTAYHAMAMPTTAIVNQSGQLHYVHQGYKPGTEAVYEEHIRALLAQESGEHKAKH